MRLSSNEKIENNERIDKIMRENNTMGENNTMKDNNTIQLNMSRILSSVIVGDSALCESGVQIGYEESIMYLFVDDLVERMGDIFSNKDIVMGMLDILSGIDNSYRNRIMDDRLNYIYSECLDDKLKNDMDVVIGFIDALYSASDNSEDSRDWYEPGVPDLCYSIPHELIMEDEIFYRLADRVSPISLYCEFLTDEEKINDELVYKLLKCSADYYQHRIYVTGAEGVEWYKEHMFRMLQETWASAVINITGDMVDDFHDIEKSAYIENKEGGIEEFFRVFFMFLSDEMFLTSYDGVKPKTIREKSDLYLKFLIDVMHDDIEEKLAVSENIVESVRNHWYQICLLAAWALGDYVMLDQLRYGRIEYDNDKQGSFESFYDENALFNFHTSIDDEVPFV